MVCNTHLFAFFFKSTKVTSRPRTGLKRAGPGGNSVMVWFTAKTSAFSLNPDELVPSR